MLLLPILGKTSTSFKGRISLGKTSFKISTKVKLVSDKIVGFLEN